MVYKNISLNLLYNSSAFKVAVVAAAVLFVPA